MYTLVRDQAGRPAGSSSRRIVPEKKKRRRGRRKKKKKKKKKKKSLGCLFAEDRASRAIPARNCHGSQIKIRSPSRCRKYQLSRRTATSLSLSLPLRTHVRVGEFRKMDRFSRSTTARHGFPNIRRNGGWERKEERRGPRSPEVGRGTVPRLTRETH